LNHDKLGFGAIFHFGVKGNRIGWKIVVSEDLMDVDEKGMRRPKGKKLQENW
jgi:hypothetical protein